MTEKEQNKNEIVVSISCITYNHAPYIRQALDGFIMQQTNFRFEVLIHDDCSTDGTDDIIREYATKYPDIIKPLYEEENQYQNGKPHGSAVWNFPRAKGKYIAICEGDDYWTDPLKLQKQVDFLESHPDFSMVFANVRLHYDSGLSNESLPLVNREYPPYEIYTEWRITTPTVLFRKAVYNTEFYQSCRKIKNPVFGDLTLFMAASTLGKIYGMNAIVAGYRRLISGATTTIRRNPYRHFKNRIFLSNMLGPKYKEFDVNHFTAAYLLWAIKHIWYKFPENWLFCYDLIRFSPKKCISIIVGAITSKLLRG